MTVNRCKTESPVPRKDLDYSPPVAVPIHSHSGPDSFALPERAPIRSHSGPDSFALPERAPITGSILSFRKKFTRTARGSGKNEAGVRPGSADSFTLQVQLAARPQNPPRTAAFAASKRADSSCKRK